MPERLDRVIKRTFRGIVAFRLIEPDFDGDSRLKDLLSGDTKPRAKSELNLRESSDLTDQGSEEFLFGKSSSPHSVTGGTDTPQVDGLPRTVV